MASQNHPMPVTGLDPDLQGSDDHNRRRYFDRRLNAVVVSVCQGDFYVTSRPNEVLSTLLGSCIAVCMRDPVAGCGGMNHFLLPAQSTPEDELPSPVLRYGSFSIERMTNALLAYGASRSRLEIKVFGGANILSGLRNYGHSNAEFVERYFAREGLRIVAKDLRGNVARRLRYYPVSGRALVCQGRGPTDRSIAAREAEIARRLQVDRTEPRVEIFDCEPAKTGGTALAARRHQDTTRLQNRTGASGRDTTG